MHKKITAHQAKKLLARKTGSGGFTLVELIVVIVIMGILTAAILPMVTGYVASAKEKVAESNQHMVEQATRLYLTDWEMANGSVSSTTITASELVEKGYLSVERQGRHNLYRPLVSEADYRRWANRSFLGKMYQSSLRRMVASLVESRDLTDRDLAELEEFIAGQRRAREEERS